MHDMSSEKYRRSVSITINLDAIRRNLATARRLSGGAKQFATIKADAYGHGATAVASALSSIAWQRKNRVSNPATAGAENGTADGFAVVTVDEALELRETGIELPILVLQGPQHPNACKLMREHGLWPVIHDLYQYDWYSRSTERTELQAWLKVDSGMGRLGVLPEEASRILSSSSGINWCGLLTHFACADEVGNPFTAQQIARFHSVNASPALSKSLANSSGILAWPQSQADWSRPGIMLYGANPLNQPLPAGVELQPAMRVQAPVISVKTVAAGSGIGYAQRYICAEDMRVAYVALGYRDGLPRVLDNSAVILLNGQACPVIGRVSMDSIAVDIRRQPDVTVGLAAEIWGQSG